jgi:hypothetical protein
VLLVVGLPARSSAVTELYAAEIATASQRFAILEAWIHAVMRMESAGDRLAISHRGAMGLMQVMPRTWATLRTRHGLGADPFAPNENILAGTAYLREMLDRFGSVPLMLAAYNAGPVRVEEHLATGRPLPAETRAYVATLAPVLTGDTDPAALRRLVERAERSTEGVFVRTGSSLARDPSTPIAAIFVQLVGASSAGSVPHDTLYAARTSTTETRGVRAAEAGLDRLFVVRRTVGSAR